MKRSKNAAGKSRQPPVAARPDGPSRALLLQTWLARAMLACVLVAAMEVAFVANAVPSLGYASAATLTLFVECIALFLPLGLLFAAGGHLLQRSGRKLSAPAPAPLMTLLVGACVGAVLITEIGEYAHRPELEFPGHVRGLSTLASAGVLAVVGAVCAFGVLPLMRRLLSPRAWLSPSRVTMVVALGLSVVAMATSHYHLFAIHMNLLAAWAGVAALGLAFVFASLAWPTSKRAARVGAAAVPLAIVLAALPLEVDRTRFMLFNHSPFAGRVAMVVRDVADRDGDGSPAEWLGGTDCDDSDPQVGSTLREIPGDGVDQDCRGGDAAPVEPPRPPPLDGCPSAPEKASVLLITVDALRWDVFVQGFAPNVSEFAKGSRVFTRAYSPGAHTRSSVASIFFGRPLSDSREGNALDARLAAGTSVTERFAKAGYYTAALQPFVLAPETQAGFTQYNSPSFDVSPGEAKADLRSAQTTNAALEVMRNREAWPVFVWAHYPDAHAPYTIPPPGSERDADTAEGAYLRAVGYVDGQIGRLLGTLHAEGFLKETVVAITADHGEDLDWRGRQGHGANLYEETVHVPLLLSVPGCAPRTEDAPVNVSWLGSTLGAMLGIEVPGLSLASSEHPVVVETDYDGEHRRAVITKSAKMIVDVRNGGRAVFDLTSDFDEKQDLVGTRPDLEADLEAAYQRWLDSPGAR